MNYFLFLITSCINKMFQIKRNTLHVAQSVDYSLNFDFLYFFFFFKDLIKYSLNFLWFWFRAQQGQRESQNLGCVKKKIIINKAKRDDDWFCPWPNCLLFLSSFLPSCHSFYLQKGFLVYITSTTHAWDILRKRFFEKQKGWFNVTFL